MLKIDREAELQEKNRLETMQRNRTISKEDADDLRNKAISKTSKDSYESGGHFVITNPFKNGNNMFKRNKNEEDGESINRMKNESSYYDNSKDRERPKLIDYQKEVEPVHLSKSLLEDDKAFLQTENLVKDKIDGLSQKKLQSEKVNQIGSSEKSNTIKDNGILGMLNFQNETEKNGNEHKRASNTNIANFKNDISKKESVGNRENGTNKNQIQDKQKEFSEIKETNNKPIRNP